MMEASTSEKRMLELVKRSSEFPIETREQAISTLYKIKSLYDRLQYLDRARERCLSEIEKAWKNVPAMTVRKERPCRICNHPTYNLVQGRPQCEGKHSRETALDILQGNI